MFSENGNGRNNNSGLSPNKQKDQALILAEEHSNRKNFIMPSIFDDDIARSYKRIGDRDVDFEIYNEWEDNFYQRPIVGRPTKTLTKFLDPEEKHYEADICVFCPGDPDILQRLSLDEIISNPNIRKILADSHTRRQVFNGLLSRLFPDKNTNIKKPEKMHCTFYLCSGNGKEEDAVKQVGRLYFINDSRQSVMSAKDMLGSAEEKLSITFNSSLFTCKNYGDGLKKAYKSLYGNIGSDDLFYSFELLNEFKEEVYLYDECNPSHKDSPAGVTAHALISFREAKGNDDLIKSRQNFWRIYFSRGGNLIDGRRDAPLNLRLTLNDARGIDWELTDEEDDNDIDDNDIDNKKKKNKKGRTGISTNTADIGRIIGICKAALDGWEENKTWVRNLTSCKPSTLRTWYKSIRSKFPPLKLIEQEDEE